MPAWTCQPPHAPRKTQSHPLTRDEVRRMFEACHPHSSTGVRDRALLALLYRGAMRIGATLRLKVSDVDWNRGVVRIYKDKGGKSRAVQLDTKTFDLLVQWKARRVLLGIDDECPLFCACRKGKYHKPLTESNVLSKVQHWAQKAGITRPVNIHLLRHTGASELLKEGFDVPTISRVLGHTNLMTTYRYLHELCPDVMNAKLGTRQW